MNIGMAEQAKLKQYLIGKDTFATTLLCIFIDTYRMTADLNNPEDDPLQWNAQTILQELQEDFGVTIPKTNFDRLMTAIYVLTNDSFFHSLPDFIEICGVLSGGTGTDGQFEPVDTVEIAWALTEALLLSPSDQNDLNPFSAEIVGYIKHMCDEEGLITLPDILQIAGKDEEATNKVNYEFSDDPEMFSSIWETEKSKTDDINNTIKARLSGLIQQLQDLPMQFGDASQIAKTMLSGLEAKSNSILQ